MRKGWFLSFLLLLTFATPMLTRADEWAPPGRVIRAVYGIHGHFIDVTRIVRHYAFPGGKMDVSNETFGFDPFRGEEKRLRVTFDTPNGRYQRVYTEGDTIRFGG